MTADHVAVDGRPTTCAGPGLPRTYVARPRLWAQLDRAMDGAVTVVVAPAGAGKTLGAAGWLRHSDTARSVRWIDGDRAWGADRLENILTWSADERDGKNPVVVIDDAHQLPPAGLELIDERLNHAPTTLRLLLLSRWDLPLTRLVPELLGHYATLRGDLVRMDDDEMAALIEAHVPAASSVVREAISAYAQGWCAPAVLTARVVAGAPDPEATARRYADAGARAPVADQIVNEVFTTLSPDERQVVLCVGGEETVTPSVAVHLSHDPRAGETLARLESTGLLVTRTGDAWSDEGGEAEPQYRIHPLLSEVARRRLQRGGVDVSRARAMVARAVRLDIARGDGALAFHRLVAVNEIDQAAALLATAGIEMVLRGEGPAVVAFAHRHQYAVDDAPGCWFVLALAHWVAGEVDAARLWMDRTLTTLGDDTADLAVLTCVRLMRTRLDPGSVPDVVEQAQHLVEAGHVRDHPAMPQLLTELGAAQNWSGDLTQAEVNLTAAVELGRQRGLLALAAAAASHLACTQLMAGCERGAVEVATEAWSLLGSAGPAHPAFVSTRASLALVLGRQVDVPWAPETAYEREVHPPPSAALDPGTRFWMRMRDARVALLAGAVADAERILTTPLAGHLPEELLPTHLHVLVLVERALLATLAADRDALRQLECRVRGLGAPAESALVQGLLADLSGDRRAAIVAFGTAAEGRSFTQPPTRALALVCQAQLLDARGHPDEAADQLQEAVRATELRRNALPFLGWCRQGTPVGILLALLDRPGSPAGDTWLHDLAAAIGGEPDITARFAPTTATPRERPAGAAPTVQPTLSPREREVLHELARGATYADIAASLFVSGNTVKTHVSSLYAKLAVSRRSEALAVARNLHLF